MDNDELFQPDTALLVPQADDFSCGPACVATVSNLYDVPGDYHHFRGLLDPNPEIGTCPFIMTQHVSRYFPVKSVGEDTYHGGIAIALIIYENPPHSDADEEGHYVVFLERRGEDILYYDPYDHQIIQKPLPEIKWVSEDGRYKNWSINFERLPGAEFEVWQKLMAEEF